MTGCFARYGRQALAAAAMLSMMTGLAMAAENTVSADQIVNALKPRQTTRGISIGLQAAVPPADAATQARDATLLAGLRNRKTRSLSLGEREQLAEIAATRPKIDLEIQFDYNSAGISKGSMPAVQELGKALSDPNLKGGTFVIAGHTDGIGGDAFNQGLSERRAETIKRTLVDQYGLMAGNLVAVGYGKSRLKNAADPADPVNRRVQVVNMDNKTAAK